MCSEVGKNSHILHQGSAVWMWGNLATVFFCYLHFREAVVPSYPYLPVWLYLPIYPTYLTIYLRHRLRSFVDSNEVWLIESELLSVAAATSAGIRNLIDFEIN